MARGGKGKGGAAGGGANASSGPAAGKKRAIEKYEHGDQERINNPQVGLVTPQTDPVVGSRRTYAYDPHLDPELVWAGKAEHTTFEVPTVSYTCMKGLIRTRLLRRCASGMGTARRLPAGFLKRASRMLAVRKRKAGWKPAVQKRMHRLRGAGRGCAMRNGGMNC